MFYQCDEVIQGDMLFEYMYASLVWYWLEDSQVTVKCVCVGGVGWGVYTHSK